jgi:hypothetical protein
MNNIYILIVYLYDVILYFFVVLFLGGYYSRVFFTRAGMSMRQNVYPRAGADAGSG